MSIRHVSAIARNVLPAVVTIAGAGLLATPKNARAR